MADEGFLIGPNLRAKLRETFRKSDEALVGKETGLLLETRYTDGPGYTPKVFRICTFTGAWSVGSAKEVTFKYQTTTPNTVSVKNLVCGLSPTGSCDVSIAKDGTAWYLVQPNLTQQPGYSSSGTHVLTIQGGNLRWLGTTACT